MAWLRCSGQRPGVDVGVDAVSLVAYPLGLGDWQPCIRDLGIYMYTTEQSAVEEYWFDQHERIFPSDWKYSSVSRVFGNDFDNGTFWTADIAASYGIELYPIHGGSFYLAAISIMCASCGRR